MAGRLAGLKTKGVASSALSRYFSGARAGGTCAWRNQTPQGSKTEVFVYNSECNIAWPDPQLGVLASTDPNFTLPGHIGTGSNYTLKSEEAKSTKPSQPDLLTEPTNKERQVHTLYSAHDYIKYTPGAEGEVCTDMIDQFPKIIGVENAEFGVHDTPLLLKKEMAALFPTQNLNAAFTTITYSQRTVNDMSKWSEEVESEREVQIERFVQTAQEVCGRLREEGHWADFIDPCSGTPHYGNHTNTTMFETDDKFRLLGFQIEDLGCCKVIIHPTFGRNVFVGCIVTNAGKNNPVVEEVLTDMVL